MLSKHVAVHIKLHRISEASLFLRLLSFAHQRLFPPLATYEKQQRTIYKPPPCPLTLRLLLFYLQPYQRMVITLGWAWHVPHTSAEMSTVKIVTWQGRGCAVAEHPVCWKSSRCDIAYLYFYDKKSRMFEHDENSGFRAAKSAWKDSWHAGFSVNLSISVIIHAPHHWLYDYFLMNFAHSGQGSKVGAPERAVVWTVMSKLNCTHLMI